VAFHSHGRDTAGVAFHSHVRDTTGVTLHSHVCYTTGVTLHSDQVEGFLAALNGAKALIGFNALDFIWQRLKSSKS